MKKLFTIILSVLMLMVFILPIQTFAAGTFALNNTSGVVYPSSELDLALQYTGDTGVVGFEFEELVYNENKLTFEKGSTPISDSYLGQKEDGGGFLFMLNDLGNAVSGKNVTLFKLDFKLKSAAKVGDRLTVTLKNLAISDATGKALYNGDLTYTVEVKEKPKNTNCNLLLLSAKEGSLTPAFDADSKNNNYAITVPHTVDSLTISATTASSLSTYRIIGNENFVIGENIVKITVTAESGAERVYTLTVTKLDPPSEDASLSGLTVEEGTLAPAFAPEVTDYTLSVGSDVFSLNFTVTTSDEKANYSITGNEKFVVGENKVEIIVTAENGDINKYTITVTRARPIETSALLSALSFGDYPFDKMFSSDQKEYTLTVPYADDLTDLLRYQTESEYATVSLTVPSEYQVGVNTIIVKVTAEDGVTVESYVVIVNREARILYSDSSLMGLTADIEGLEPAFSPDVLVYTLVTAPKCMTVTFTAIPNEFSATTEETVVKEVVPGLNTIILTCTAENGEITEYTVYVFVPVVEQKRELILNGTPQVGEKLTLTVLGDSEGGSYKWYVGGVPVEGVDADSYLLLSSATNKTIYAEYTDKDGTVLVSQTVTVTAAPDVTTGGRTLSTADILIMSITVVIAFLVGGLIGALFFGQKSKKF